MLKKIRRFSQVVFFILFTFTVFALTRVPAAYSFPTPWMLRLNPLTGLLTFIASHKISVSLAVSGAVIAAATLLFGRFFCGAICPLGAFIDFSDRYLFARMRNRRIRPALWLQKLKYVLVMAMLAMSAFGVMIPFFMDPILLLTRMFTLVVTPLSAVISTDALALLAPLLSAAGLSGIAYTTIHIPLYYGIAGSVVLTALILCVGFLDRRFWCQYVCPSGALFGLLSRFAIFRRRINIDECNSCRACVTVCPARAITEDGRKTSTAECILCGLCTARKKTCSSFGFASWSGQQTCGADIQRRHVISGILSGLIMVPAIRANASAKRADTGRMIRPPGAVPENEFLARCISCGACMKVCPTNAIQPCGLADGFQRVYTPKIVPRIGGCEEKCHACGYACPTGAIRRLSYEEKRFVKIGTAVIDRHRCLAWEQNKECLVCDEVCPYNAITAAIVETTTGVFKVPVVNESLCLGCGMCEQHCPITDQAAIIVYNFSENRRSSGTYVSEKDKLKILDRRRESDSDIGASLTGNTPEIPAEIDDTDSISAARGQSGLPPGFSD